ncbi:MAG: 16S rRNA (cytidine(1402)-2'-O)-methyltransferase [Ruminococcaceae bacterium]|nr:16S rRNA (cytidine(1402)-2'-O)-methyltransferase [Oscillospiraceae bacterium]
MSGTLYLCATPIGNLGDMTPRCIETLSMVDLIAAEDTRQTVKLLNHFGIDTKMTSYYEHNKYEKGGYLISLLKEGKNIAVVSDAGTPGISDPGEELVEECIKNDITVVSIPGPAALISAVITSGLCTGRFCFEGFLSMNRRQRKIHLEEIKNEKRTMIFYEAPHKLCRTLDDLYETLGDRRIALARELTKKFEQIIRTTIKEAIAMYEETPPKGEYVLVIEGATEQQEAVDYSDLSIEEHVKSFQDEGMSEMDAIKAVAKQRGLRKNEVYAAVKKK